MSYHIVSIDAPNCSLTCKSGQLICREFAESKGAKDGIKQVPLEDVAAIVITSFSASIHSKLLLEAAKKGVALILCDAFTPASLVLPANRATDTLLTRAQISLTAQTRKRLWNKTIDAKTANQLSLATHLAPAHFAIEELGASARGRKEYKEAHCAKLFWKIFGDTLVTSGDFRRERGGGGPNSLLNYGYAVLLSTVLQKCFAVGIDPTFGISHVTREHSTPLAYDLMEPFRPCVDWRVIQWILKHPADENGKWPIDKAFRGWVTGFPLEKIEHFGLTLDIRSCIEGVVRAFRRSVIENKTGLYKPWIQPSSKWAG